MNKQVSYAYQHLSRTETLFKGENKNINISVSKNSPVNASLSLDGYKHSMVQIIALTIALKMKTVIVNPPIVSDTYVFIAIINELGGTAKIYNKRLFIDASTICNANIPFFLGKCIHGSMYLCPALLIALGKFEYYGSGGCQIGDSIDSHNRPFSHIASVIECFNHKISIESNRIIGNFGDNSDITELDIKNFSYSSEDLSGPLVGGATKTALLLSVNKQKFIIKNPYLKTDVYDMIDFLRLIGKKIDISDNSIVCSGNVMASSNQYIEFILLLAVATLYRGIGMRYSFSRRNTSSGTFFVVPCSFRLAVLDNQSLKSRLNVSMSSNILCRAKPYLKYLTVFSTLPLLSGSAPRHR